jgi:hypothetical protein
LDKPCIFSFSNRVQGTIGLGETYVFDNPLIRVDNISIFQLMLRKVNCRYLELSLLLLCDSCNCLVLILSACLRRSGSKAAGRARRGGEVGIDRRKSGGRIHIDRGKVGHIQFEIVIVNVVSQAIKYLWGKGRECRWTWYFLPRLYADRWILDIDEIDGL